LSQLSDKELLEVMAEFPKHALNTKQRTNILKVLGESGGRKQRNPINVQRFAAMAAVLIMLMIAPILYFSHSEDKDTVKTGAKGETVQQVEKGDTFALIDKNGSHYVDSNYGIPNQVSLLAPKDWVAADERSVAKMMIFLWGNYEKDFANKTLKVNATNVETGAKEQLATAVIAGGMYGADAHALTSFKPFTLSGAYNLEFMAGNKKVGEFSIYVKEPYVQIGDSTLMISKEDLYAGFYENVPIEVSGENLPPEIELELFQVETAEVTTYTFKDKTDYTTTDGKQISVYTGDFQLKKSGKYRISVMQRSEVIDVRKPISK
jgi:hypothetical protein